MNQNNNIVEYWGERIEKIKKQEYNQVEKYAKEIKEQYDLVEKSIRYELFLFYSKYAKENGLSYIETKKLLKEDEMQQWKISLEEYKNLAQKKENKQYLNEMYIRSRINRLDSLQAQIQAHVRLLGEKQEEKTAEILKDIFKDTYNRTTYEIDKVLGFQVRYDMFDEKEVNNIVNKPWLESNFSDRIWKDKSNLIDELQKTLMQHVVLGKAASQLSDEFAKKFETSFNKAYRLLNTESAYITEQATLESYKNTNVNKYELLAVLDLRTSEICREMDGKRFFTKDARVGVNYPPFHPNCRTTTIPCVLEEFDKDSERVYKDPLTGKPKNIKSDMTYNEWLKQMEVEHGTEKIQAEQKKIKNRAADEKQYKKYLNVLDKDNMPETFEKWQEMKYNDIKEYKLTKYNYKLRREALQNPDNVIKNIYIAEGKYTKYLFDGENEKGLVKGNLIDKVLGYNKNNYKEFDAIIKENIGKYPRRYKGEDKYGKKYEVNMVIKGLKNRQAKITIGSRFIDEEYKLSSMYISELKESDLKHED